MIVAARIRFRHRGCYSENLTPEMKVIHWGQDSGDCMVTVTGPRGADFDDVIGSFAPFVDAPPKVIERSDTSVVVRCLCIERTPHAQHLQNLGAVYLWPVIYEGGYEWFSLMAPSQEVMSNVVNLLKTLGDVEVEKLSELAADDVALDPRQPKLEAHLTARQDELVRFALRRGYYRLPRQVTIAELAHELNISPSTLQEHLQKATERLMSSLLSPSEPAGSPYAETRG